MLSSCRLIGLSAAVFLLVSTSVDAAPGLPAGWEDVQEIVIRPRACRALD